MLKMCLFRKNNSVISEARLQLIGLNEEKESDDDLLVLKSTSRYEPEISHQVVQEGHKIKIKLVSFLLSSIDSLAFFFVYICALVIFIHFTAFKKTYIIIIYIYLYFEYTLPPPQKNF